MDKKEIIAAIEKMSVVELNDLVKALEEKFEVTAQPPVVAGMGAIPGQAGQPEPAAEKTSFDVVLKSAGDKKIQVIKTIREIVSLGLKESKELVDKAPTAVKEGIAKEEAEEIKKKLETAGAAVEIK